MTEAHVASIKAELQRIEESATYSAQGQFEQAKLWRGLNLAIGAPAAALAGIAGATALASTSGRIAAGIIALVAAGLGAVAASLNAAQRIEQAQSAANRYLSLQSDARIAHLVDLCQQDATVARDGLMHLRARQDEINQSASPPSFYAYWRARTSIAQNRQNYVVDPPDIH